METSLNKLSSLSLLAMLGAASGFVASSASAATVIINDSFDDGAIGTNTLGTGTGFYSYEANGGTVAESGGAVVLASAGHGGHISSIGSKDSLDATVAESVFAFSGVSFADVGGGGSGVVDRVFVGVRQSETLGTAGSAAALGHGFYVTFGNDAMYSNVLNDKGSLTYINESGTAAVLASWTWDTLSFLNSTLTPVLDISIGLTANSWSFDITGDTQGGGSTISFSGTDPAAFGGDDNHGVTTGHAYAFNQNQEPNMNMTIEGIEVTAVPEPGSYALLAGLAGMAFVMARRRI